MQRKKIYNHTEVAIYIKHNCMPIFYRAYNLNHQLSDRLIDLYSPRLFKALIAIAHYGIHALVYI